MEGGKDAVMKLDCRWQIVSFYSGMQVKIQKGQLYRLTFEIQMLHKALKRVPSDDACYLFESLVSDLKGTSVID